MNEKSRSERRYRAADTMAETGRQAGDMGDRAADTGVPTQPADSLESIAAHQVKRLPKNAVSSQK